MEFIFYSQTQNRPCLSTMQICCVAGLEELAQEPEELAQEPEETVENHSTLHLVDYVERGIADFLKLGPIPFIELYGIVLNPFFFLVF